MSNLFVDVEVNFNKTNNILKATSWILSMLYLPSWKKLHNKVLSFSSVLNVAVFCICISVYLFLGIDIFVQRSLINAKLVWNIARYVNPPQSISISL